MADVTGIAQIGGERPTHGSDYKLLSPMTDVAQCDYVVVQMLQYLAADGDVAAPRQDATGNVADHHIRA